MKNNYRSCLAKTLVHEGGYANHPKDPGGSTYKGVTQRVYDAYRRSKRQPTQDVRKILQPELEALYRTNYWNSVKGDQLPKGLDYCLFDYAVNSGPSRAIKHLQAILGVKVDGVMGPVTLEAIYANHVRYTIDKLIARRQAFVRGLRIYSTFGKGWERRISSVHEDAKQMVSSDYPTQPHPETSFWEALLDAFIGFFGK